MIIVKNWLIDTLVRAVKTAAQSLVALLGAGQATLIHVSWGADLAVAGFAGLVCILHNIQGAPIGSDASPVLGTAAILDPNLLDASLAPVEPAPAPAPAPAPTAAVVTTPPVA